LLLLAAASGTLVYRKMKQEVSTVLVLNEYDRIPYVFEPRRRMLAVGGVHLCCIDFGGPIGEAAEQAANVLIVHGLAGRASEWRSTAHWLTQTHHVYAFDQRGHGVSDKIVTDFSRDAYVNDVIGVIEQLQIAPVILIGQSMGGINAFLVAARRPDLVRGLVVIEASASENPLTQDSVREWLSSWPLPFPTLTDARLFFGGRTLFAETWIEVLEERQDGYWPQFNLEHMVASMADITTRDYWDEWDKVRCPTLVVGGAASYIDQQELQKMAARIPDGRYSLVPHAGHDLHLEQPDLWQQAVLPFLFEISDPTEPIWQDA
jgi:pimeloyl-ACP methyl ester carboxylesterase